MPDTKIALRASARAARSRLPGKGNRSEAILRRVVRLDEYRTANRVAYYVDVRDEVRTRPLLVAELESGKRSIFIPYCEGEVLRLVEIRAMSELGVGKFGILEPQKWLRESRDRHAEISGMDVVLVPGVAFSRRGDRIGYGAGYYDRLLASSGATKIGLAFECQLFDAIPTDPFDVRMDYICTENESFSCKPFNEPG